MIIHDRETLKVLIHPLRSRLVTAMAQEPRTVKELSAIVDREATKLYYHIKLLQKAGIIAAAGERQIGNLTETSYLCTAKFYVVDPEMPQGMGKGSAFDDTAGAFLSMLRSALLASFRLAEERKKARQGELCPQGEPEPGEKTFTLAIETLKLGAGETEEFAKRIKELIVEFGDRHEGKDGGDYYEIGYALYPSASSLSRPEPSRDVGENKGEKQYGS